MASEMVERLALKRQQADEPDYVESPNETVRWWINALANELAKKDDGRSLVSVTTVAKWLRAQASEE